MLNWLISKLPAMNTICPFIDWFCIEKYFPTGFNRQKRPIHVMNHVMSFMVTHQCTLVFLFTIINSKHDYERKNLKSRSALQETNSCHFLSMVSHQCTLVFLFTIINSKHDYERKNLKSRSALQVNLGKTRMTCGSAWPNSLHTEWTAAEKRGLISCSSDL